MSFRLSNAWGFFNILVAFCPVSFFFLVVENLQLTCRKILRNLHIVRHTRAFTLRPPCLKENEIKEQRIATLLFHLIVIQ